MPGSLHTKRLFADSLKDLMRTKSLEEISVGDIATHCEMSRNAFYYHFQDKFDLVNWVFRTESAAYFAQEINRENWSSVLHSFYDYFRENRVFYCNALAYTGQNSLQDYLFETVQDILVQHIHGLRKPEYRNWTEKEIGFAADFFATAIVGMLARWARQGMVSDEQNYNDCLRVILSGSMIEDFLDSQQNTFPARG